MNSKRGDVQRDEDMICGERKMDNGQRREEPDRAGSSGVGHNAISVEEWR
jgi:hypothetical protein